MRGGSTSFDVARTAHELQSFIGARVKKAYQPHWEQVVLRLNRSGEGTTDLVIVRGARVYQSNRDRPMPVSPSPFAMVLRKHLGNGRLIGVEQHGFDRILTLIVDTKDGELRLVIELFRDGNIILLDPDGVIIQPLTHVTYASRTLKRGVVYEWPPEQVDPRGLDEAGFAAILDDSDADLARTLAARVNLGGPYAHAVCAAAGIDSSLKAAKLDEARRGSVHTALATMLEDLAGGKGAYAWYADEAAKSDAESVDGTVGTAAAPGGIVEVGPVRMATNDDALAVEFASLSEAVDGWKGAHDAAALHRLQEERLEQEGADEATSEDRLNRRAAQQEEAIGRFIGKATKAQATATSVQKNWTHVEDLLTQVRGAVERHGWQAVSEQIRDIVWIESVDPAKRTMNAFLPDDDGEPGERVMLRIEDTVHQNAQRFFGAARSQKEKSSGAARALSDTRREKERDEKKAAKDEAAGRVRGVARSKRFWFERHRWALLSGGHLLVGGRDAKGNDAIVRKHLEKDDVYVHADLHGAPSCSLKRREGLATAETSEPGSVPALKIVQDLQPLTSESTDPTPSGGDFDEATGLSAALLGEAAQMAVCWSRAWAGGAAAATAFHVRPGQVSKKTETGEALGRGAFVVRGKRLWHRDRPLEFGLGIATVNGVPLPITGPVAAIAAVCERWARIAPGRTKKETLANHIAKTTGLVQDDVLAALPSGQCEIADDHGLLD